MSRGVFSLGGVLKAKFAEQYTVMLDGGLRCTGLMRKNAPKLDFGLDLYEQVVAETREEDLDLQCYLPILEAGAHNFTVRVKHYTESVIQSPGDTHTLPFRERNEGLGYAMIAQDKPWSIDQTWNVGHDLVSAAGAEVYTVLVVPQIASISTQQSGLLGRQTVVIRGSGFSPASGAKGCSGNVVKLAGVGCAVTSCTHNELHCIAGRASAAGAETAAPFASTFGLRQVTYSSRSKPPNFPTTLLRQSDAAFTGAMVSSIYEKEAAIGLPVQSEHLIGVFVAPLSAWYSFYVASADSCQLQIGMTDVLGIFPEFTWTQCASENRECSCFGHVRYGKAGTFTAPTPVDGSVGCNNNVFGDPLPGVGKICECSTNYGDEEDIGLIQQHSDIGARCTRDPQVDYFSDSRHQTDQIYMLAGARHAFDLKHWSPRSTGDSKGTVKVAVRIHDPPVAKTKEENQYHSVRERQMVMVDLVEQPEIVELSFSNVDPSSYILFQRVLWGNDQVYNYETQEYETQRVNRMRQSTPIGLNDANGTELLLSVLKSTYANPINCPEITVTRTGGDDLGWVNFQIQTGCTPRPAYQHYNDIGAFLAYNLVSNYTDDASEPSSNDTSTDADAGLEGIQLPTVRSSGFFTVSFDGIDQVSLDVRQIHNTNYVEGKLELFNNVEVADVKRWNYYAQCSNGRSRTCLQFGFTVVFQAPSGVDYPLMQIGYNNTVRPYPSEDRGSVTVVSTTLVDGVTADLFYDPIPGHMFEAAPIHGISKAVHRAYLFAVQCSNWACTSLLLRFLCHGSSRKFHQGCNGTV